MSQIDQNDVGAVLVRADTAARLTGDPTNVIALLADSEAPGGGLTCNRTWFREGAVGAPPHYHTRASELFFVLDGALQVLTGDRVVTLTPGDLLVVPPKLPHAFGPAPGAAAEVLIVFSPGMARFDYYRLLDRVARGEARPQEIRASQERFDNHYVESAIWQAARVAPRPSPARTP